MNKKYAIPILLLLSIFLIPVFTFASQEKDGMYKDDMPKVKIRDEDRTQASRDKMEEMAERQEERQQNREEVKTQNREQLCENLNKRISNRVQVFTDNKDRHVENYQKFVTRVEEIITTLEGKGYDVADLTTHVAVMDEMIKQYAVDYSNFITTLDESKALPCGEGDGQYKEAMKSAQTELKALRDQRYEIRKYYAEVIRQDIASIRQQAASMMEDTTGGEQ